MALFRSMGARKDATRGTAPIEVRKGLANLFSGAGVLQGADSTLVAGTAGWAYSVGKAGFVTTRGTSDGVHLFGNDGSVTVGSTGVGSTVPVAPSAGLSRIDVIWVKHPAAGENADTISEPSFGVASGTAASLPVAPSIPTGALEVGRNTMTSSATSTASAGNTITQTAARASLVGGAPYATWSGFATTAAGGTWSVAFPAGRFTLAPQVFVTVNGSTFCVAMPTSPTPGGCVGQSLYYSGGTWQGTAGFIVQVFAVQQTSTSAVG